MIGQRLQHRCEIALALLAHDTRGGDVDRGVGRLDDLTHHVVAGAIDAIQARRQIRRFRHLGDLAGLQVEQEDLEAVVGVAEARIEIEKALEGEHRRRPRAGELRAPSGPKSCSIAPESASIRKSPSSLWQATSAASLLIDGSTQYEAMVPGPVSWRSSPLRSS